MYEIFIYLGEQNRLIGNYLKVNYIDYKPYIGMDAGEGYVVSGVYDSLGIVDVVCDKKSLV